MWTSVLVLALLLNIEPLRAVGFVPLMLSRPHPMMQLFAFLSGSVLMLGGIGLLILFVFHRNPLSSDESAGPKIQVGIGVVGLVIAAALAVKSTSSAADPPPNSESSGQMRKATARAREILRKGNSPGWAFVIGLTGGLPSGDFLALLLVIGSSGATPPVQASALLTFLVVGNAVIILTLVSFLFAPEWTGAWNDRFQHWIRSRTRRDFAVLVAIASVALIVVGLRNLGTVTA